MRARSVRDALGRLVVAARGALGISSKTCADGGKERRTATRAPPADTFSAVANSRKSLPLSSRLRTNTGIASGSLGHFRRSISGFRRFKFIPSNRKLTLQLRHLSCQTAQLPLSNFRPAPQILASASSNSLHRSCVHCVRLFFAAHSRFWLWRESLATATIFPSVLNS